MTALTPLAGQVTVAAMPTPPNDRPRKPDTGLIRPYRPCPPDFRQRYLALGQTKDLEEHYRTNWRVITRWIDEAGGDALREERAAVSGGFVRPKQRRARRYVMGQTLGGAKSASDGGNASS